MCDPRRAGKGNTHECAIDASSWGAAGGEATKSSALIGEGGGGWSRWKVRTENCVFQKAIFRCNGSFSILKKSISVLTLNFINRFLTLTFALQIEFANRMLAFQFENRPFNSTFYFVNRLLIFDFDFSLWKSTFDFEFLLLMATLGHGRTEAITGW